MMLLLVEQLLEVVHFLAHALVVIEDGLHVGVGLVLLDAVDFLAPALTTELSIFPVPEVRTLPTLPSRRLRIGLTFANTTPLGRRLSFALALPVLSTLASTILAHCRAVMTSVGSDQFCADQKGSGKLALAALVLRTTSRSRKSTKLRYCYARPKCYSKMAQPQDDCHQLP